METAKIYPIDTDQLNKGDKIPAEVISQICGFSPSDARFSIESLKLKEYIVSRLSERGEIVTVISDKNNLRILSDEEAVDYNQYRFRRHFGGMVGSHMRMLGIDTAQLSEAKQKEHERVCLRQGMVICGAREAWKAPLIANERQTPKISAGE